MSPEPPPPDLTPVPDVPQDLAPLPEVIPAPEIFPFWGYLDIAAFILIAILGLIGTAAMAGAFLSVTHVKPLLVELPAQFVLYAFLLWILAVIFRRYYGRPFWQSMRWIPTGVSTSWLVTSGILLAFAVILAGNLMRIPDTQSPMKELLSDRTSVILVAIFGTTLGPLCEEIFFRGFLQPVLVRSLGAVQGILAAAIPFGLLHLQEYGYSWRHALLITMAGAAFGWVRQRTDSTKAAVIIHATYNCVFFVLLVMQLSLPMPR